MSNISKRDLILLLIGIDPEGNLSEGFGGITRLQKYHFLLEREEKIKPSGQGFEFEAYKAGPYSSKLYDDLEFLENLGYIQSEITAEATELEEEYITELSYDDLMSDGSEQTDDGNFDGLGASDAYEERRFISTEKGRNKVNELLKKEDYKPITDSIRKIKSKFNYYSLSDILCYIYTKYPEMTVESEIREKVLKRRKS